MKPAPRLANSLLYAAAMALGLACCPFPAAAADSTAAASHSASTGVQLASGDISERGLRRLAGKSVRTDAGERLGTLTDFVLDTSSGRIVYAILSAGTQPGMGETLRAVPPEALQRSTAFDGFVSDIAMKTWLEMPVVDEKDFAAGRLTLNPEQYADLQRRFGVPRVSSTERIAGAPPQGDAMRLQRASDIRGKAVQSGAVKVGDIEEIVIDLEQRTAAALVDPKRNFAGAEAKFLVPLRLLDLTSPDNLVTTKLARADFDSALHRRSASDLASHSESANVGAIAPAVSRDEHLSPTGRTSADQTPEADAWLVESARKVRRALDSDTTLAHANILVSPEDGKVVLRGFVRDEATMKSVDRLARTAAGNTQVENQIALGAQNTAK